MWFNQLSSRKQKVFSCIASTFSNSAIKTSQVLFYFPFTSIKLFKFWFCKMYNGKISFVSSFVHHSWMAKVNQQQQQPKNKQEVRMINKYLSYFLFILFPTFIFHFIWFYYKILLDVSFDYVCMSYSWFLSHFLLLEYVVAGFVLCQKLQEGLNTKEKRKERKEFCLTFNRKLNFCSTLFLFSFSLSVTFGMLFWCMWSALVCVILLLHIFIQTNTHTHIASFFKK